jgi:hypothetical protein
MEGGPRREVDDALRLAAKDGPDVDVERELVQQRLQIDTDRRGDIFGAQEARDVRQQLLGCVDNVSFKLFRTAERGSKHAALADSVVASSLRTAQADDNIDRRTYPRFHPCICVLENEIRNLSI